MERDGRYTNDSRAGEVEKTKVVTEDYASDTDNWEMNMDDENDNGDILDLDNEQALEEDTAMDEAFQIAEKRHVENQKSRLKAATKIQSIQRGRKSRQKTLKRRLN